MIAWTRVHLLVAILAWTFCIDVDAQNATPDPQFSGRILFDRAGEKSAEASRHYAKNQGRLMMIARNLNKDELNRQTPNYGQSIYVLSAPKDLVAEVSWEIEGDTGAYILWPRTRHPGGETPETPSFQYLTAAMVKEKVLPDDVVDDMRNHRWEKADGQISDFIAILQTTQIAKNLSAQAEQKNIAPPDILLCSLLSELLGGKGKMGDHRVEAAEDEGKSLKFERTWLREYLKHAGSLRKNDSDKRQYLADALDCWATFASFKYSKKRGTFGTGALNKNPRIAWVKTDQFSNLNEDMVNVWTAVLTQLDPVLLNLTTEQVRKLKKLHISPAKLRKQNAQSVDLFQLQELIRALKASNPLRDSSVGR